MSLETKIREAFGKRNPSRYDPEEKPNLYELDKYLRKSGYRLIDAMDVGLDIPELLIEPIKEDYLHPEIDHDYKEKKFYIELERHGALETSDLELLLQGYTNALEVMKHLESLDLSKLEYDRDELEEEE